jgi:hypothetical protein
MRKRYLLRMDRRASGYMESILAIMVISAALGLIMASLCSIDRAPQDGRGLREEAAAWSSRILGILSDDGLTVESKNLARLDDLAWEPVEAMGMRVEIHVLSSVPEDRAVISFGSLPDAVDACYSSRVPIDFIEEGPEVKAAVLRVVVW